MAAKSPSARAREIASAHPELGPSEIVELLARRGVAISKQGVAAALAATHATRGRPSPVRAVKVELSHELYALAFARAKAKRTTVAKLLARLLEREVTE